MKKLIAVVLLLSCVVAKAALVTNVQKLSLFGVTNYLSPTGLVAVAPYFGGTDHFKGIAAQDFLATAGSNTLLAITNFVKAQNTVVSNGLVTLVLNTSNSLFAVSVLVSNGVITQIITASNSLVTVINNSSTVTSNSLVTQILAASNSVAGASFARLELDTNGVLVGLGTNLNFTYGITGSVAGTVFTLGVDDRLANLLVSNGLIAQLVILSNNITAASFAGLELLTNGVRVAISTNIDFVAGVTGYVSGASVKLGVSASGGSTTFQGGYISGITNIGYSTTNVFIDLGQTNYAVWNITNTAGPVNLLFTNLTQGFNFTVLIDGENIDGGTTASNMPVTYVWPAASSLLAQWLGFQTNTWVTSNRVLGISGLIRKTNSVIISSRE